MVLEHTNSALREAMGHYHSLITKLFMERNEVLEQMPENFELVPLPIQNPEVTQYALHLAAKHKEPAQPIVYASIAEDSVTFLLSEGPLEVALTPTA